MANTHRTTWRPLELPRKKHINQRDVFFEIISEYKGPDFTEWTGHWYTIGTTRQWRTVYETIRIKNEDLDNWLDYNG